MNEEVHVHTHGPVGHLSLARPRALHALTQGMCEAMSEALLGWRDDPQVTAVMIDHAEGRGFCAGGDVALVRRSALEDGGKQGRAFFFSEYRLNHLLFTYPKPVIAFMDGVTMGGGVGIALPARYRVATENTLFSMPEGAIGLFPDVGAGWYLPRLPDRIGQFLALTGARLDGAECLWTGLATHFLPSERLAEAKARIITRPNETETILAELSAEPPQARLAANAERIARLFASDRLEDILAALEVDGSEWAEKELKAVRAKSPLTCKVALRQFAEGATLTDFAEEMKIEYRLGARMIMQPDFAEGVRAVLIDKDQSPRWNPARPQDVSDELVDSIFAPLPENEEWTPFPQGV